MKTRIGDFKQYGTEETTDGVMFTFAAPGPEDCAILLYHTNDGTLKESVPISREYRIGDVYSVVLLGVNNKKHGYRIGYKDKTFVDPYAKRIFGRDRWMDERREKQQYRVLGGIVEDTYQWKSDHPGVLPKNAIMYKLHMRGFTMQHGVSPAKKGNYRGVMEKIPYLQSLGINVVEIQPMYEFEEIFLEKRTLIDPKGVRTEEVVALDKTNYWGYGDAFYMAPKASYFGGKQASAHCKEMIDEFHQAKIEVVMEIAFATGVSPDYMMDCLWHWVKEYRIDGFHLVGCEVPIERIATDKRFADTKIFCEYLPEEVLQKEKNRKHLFLYNDSFMYVGRQIQNHMEGSMVQFTNYVRRQNESYGFVNYMANTTGFTLWDSYSYGEKHNWDNGEKNCDGNNTNYSFNYGIEGETKNKQIYQMRMQQMRNGLCMTFLSQGIPLLLAGDEVANSQMGNNNIYCQDNPVGWNQFLKTKGRGELLDFTKKLIEFRKEHEIIHMEEAMHLSDVKHLGAPDLSYHGQEPWLMRIGPEQKAIGILYLGAYAKKDGKNVYIAYNYHYEQVEMALPKLPNARKWQLVVNTAEVQTHAFEPQEMREQRSVFVPAGSISILIS